MIPTPLLVGREIHLHHPHHRHQQLLTQHRRRGVGLAPEDLERRRTSAGQAPRALGHRLAPLRQLVGGLGRRHRALVLALQDIAGLRWEKE